MDRIEHNITIKGLAVSTAMAGALLSGCTTGNAPSGEVDGHLVQLGSFSSQASAERAWEIYVSRYPELADHQRVITEAVLDGKRYFRVSAAGFDRVDSSAMCDRVDAANGDGCISWAAANPLPGAVDTGIRLASR